MQFASNPCVVLKIRPRNWLVYCGRCVSIQTDSIIPFKLFLARFLTNGRGGPISWSPPVGLRMVVTGVDWAIFRRARACWMEVLLDGDPKLQHNLQHF